MDEPLTPLAVAGSTCWRTERAQRVALLVDAEAYFSAARLALRNAQRSVFLIGWDFDPRTDLEPRQSTPDARTPFGRFLLDLAAARPGLRIRILVWDMALPISAMRQGYPQRAGKWFGDALEFHLDSTHPPGSCHHQKILVIDDSVAFCGGSDFAVDRWDSTGHRDGDARRRLPSGKLHPPRHDVMMMVDGDAARALGELARTRWRRAVGSSPEPATPRADAWPAGVTPTLHDVPVAIALTEPGGETTLPVLENRALHLASIAAARHTVYLENQYLAAPEIGEALAARLADSDGPAVVIVCPTRSPSYFDRLAIDPVQRALLAELAAADRHGRLRACTPFTAGGEPIIVHSKVSIIDERLLRVGSTNLNNRSLGFDTECDLAIDAGLADERDRPRIGAAIATFRNALLSHHLAVSPADFDAALGRHGGLIAAIDALASRFLRRVPTTVPDSDPPARSLLSEYHLGDPQGVFDAWRPWRRRRGSPRTPPE